MFAKEAALESEQTSEAGRRALNHIEVMSCFALRSTTGLRLLGRAMEGIVGGRASFETKIV